MVTKDNIIHLIETKRAELNKMVQDKKRIDDNVIKKSQELDLLLNIFDNNIKRKAQ